MAEATLKKKLEDQLNCSVCLETYTEPKQLQCHHIYCQKCTKTLVDQDPRRELRCPNCRQVTPVPDNGVAGLPAAFHINYLLDILNEQKKAKESLSVLYCADHQERELEAYCESCAQLICLQCTITEHTGHKCSLVKDILEKHTDEIKATLIPAKERLSAVRKASKCVKALKYEILNHQATQESKIYRDNRELVDIITARTHEHVDKLQRITEEKVRDLDSQVEQLDTIETQLGSGVDMVEEILTTGTPAKVASIKTTIVRQVKEQTASLQMDTLQPVTQADMNYSISKEVVEVSRKYGKVYISESPDPSMCQAAGKGLEVATVGEKAFAVLQAINFNGQPLAKPIQSSECELVSNITGSKTRGRVERRGQSQYKISYQPIIKGRHQLHIKVEDQHIRGSPFTVASPVEKLGTPLRTIDGVRKPWGVAINQRGEVLVTEFTGHCVSVYSYIGERRLRSFGARGHGEGQFENPTGIALDCDDNILVVDSKNHRIQKFSADGQFLAAVGTEGEGHLQFSQPKGIAVNKRNNKLYVADMGNNRVQVLNSDLTFSSTFGNSGGGRGQLEQPYSAAFDSSGNVYITNKDNHRIKVFTAEGKFLRKLRRRGEGRGALAPHPRGIAIDAEDRVYVSDVNNCVSVFKPGGEFVTSWGASCGGFESPRGIAVDNCGMLLFVYVCDHSNCRVQLF